MPVPADGETADAEGLSVDRRDARSSGDNTPALRRRLLICLAIVVLIGAIGGAILIQFAPDLLFDEPSCASPPGDPKRGGCIASLPIPDIVVTISATVHLSPDGDTLLLGGPLRNDTTKVVLAGFNIAERREAWRTALDDFGPDVRVTVSKTGDKAAAWGAGGIRVLNLPSGSAVIAVPAEAIGTHLFFDVAFSEDGNDVLTGDASRRKSFRLAGAASEPGPDPGFDRIDTCRPLGHVGQSNLGTVRSRDGRMVVLLPTAMTAAPVQVGRSAPSRELSAAICGTSSVAVLVGPAGWEDVTALFASFSPNNDRLAIVYAGKTPRGQWRTLIDIWDAQGRMQRLASFPVRGNVGYRIGWSHDARRLAAVRSRNDATDALIYAIP
ncbi:hypothetical protein CQ14_26635 [Bradyrhizobium lablabi]|uniref:Uncharacterized protein n=1 Tax=Bradyrhizobium lablabi TaxID=722472 RepID=A0A0R3N147_9BRAD|nr:hypothetical protein [Bradyrhizobium lablabi]KRR26073.1 hypothetical protein CQ14_26635 [Bradyrhizobium lablabi]